MLRRIGAEAREVRSAEQLRALDGLIIPGGESTTLGRLIEDFHLLEPLRVFRCAALQPNREGEGRAFVGDAATLDPAAHQAGRELLEDERNFIDHANSPLWFGDEHVIFG